MDRMIDAEDLPRIDDSRPSGQSPVHNTRLLGAMVRSNSLPSTSWMAAEAVVVVLAEVDQVEGES